MPGSARALGRLDAALAAMALIRIVFAAMRMRAGLVSGTAFTPLPVLVAHLTVPALAGMGLLLFGRGDPRARPLGMAFLVSASAFADLGLAGAPGRLASLLHRLQPVAFLPFYIWTFLHRFPVRLNFGVALRLDRALRGLSLVLGLTWFVLELGVWPLLDLAIAPGWGTLLRELGRSGESGLFWVCVWTLILPGLPYTLHKLRLGGLSDRRRGRVVLAAVLVGVTPAVLLLGAWSVVPFARAALSEPRWIPAWTGVVHASVLSVPITVTWAVLTRRALGVRLVVRQAVWYVLARQTAVLLLALPALGLAVLPMANRNEGVAAALDGAWGPPLIVSVVLGGAVLSFRREVFDGIDRRFFRDQYETREILGALTDRVADLSRTEEVLEAVRTEIDRAFHPRTVEIFLPTDGDGLAPAGRGFASLILPDGVTDRLMTGEEVLRLDQPRWSDRGGSLASFSLLVPLRDDAGAVVAVLALGEKRSELPYTQEDLRLLRRVAAVLGLQFRRLHRGGAPDSVGGRGEPNARECPTCAALSDDSQCGRCSVQTVQAPVPRLLLGKIQIVARVGQGGMGVVYRGVDRTLGRPVAVKTLPPALLHASGRALREARTMASVVHPNVAVIYGAESWRGAPILLVEYLAGGTLRDRLQDAGPLSWPEAVALTSALAGGVRALHAAGILHRDIKPSNVGFTADGVPKLLDFGLARAETESVEWATDLENGAGAEAAMDTRTGALVGTLPYLAPEVVAGQRPEPAVDIWALSVMLFECVSGVSPFLERTPALTAIRLRKAEPPDPALLPADLPDPVRNFLHDALTPNGRGRPRTARQFIQGVSRLG